MRKLRSKVSHTHFNSPNLYIQKSFNIKTPCLNKHVSLCLC